MFWRKKKDEENMTELEQAVADHHKVTEDAIQASREALALLGGKFDGAIREAFGDKKNG